MSENQYIPSMEEVTRMRHETGAGHGTSKEALIRARGDWTDARRIIRYSGTVKLGAVLREIDAKRADNMNAKIAELQTSLTAATERAEAAEAERDALRKVYEAAKVYCGNRTVVNEPALIDAVLTVAMAVQPTTGETHE